MLISLHRLAIDEASICTYWSLASLKVSLFIPMQSICSSSLLLVPVSYACIDKILQQSSSTDQSKYTFFSQCSKMDTKIIVFLLLFTNSVHCQIAFGGVMCQLIQHFFLHFNHKNNFFILDILALFFIV